MKHTKLFPFAAILLALVATSCGGGDDDDDTLNLAGNWTFTLTYLSNTCGAPAPIDTTDTFDATIQQSGNQLVITDSSGDSLTGSVSGSQMTIGGTVQTTTDAGCNARITYNGTGSGNDNRVNGTISTNTVVTPAGGCTLSGSCGINFSFVANRR